jgi:hypothetical protein
MPGQSSGLISVPPTVQTKYNKVSIICLNCLNTILAMTRQQLLAMDNGDGKGDGQLRTRLQLPMVMETAMANGKGNCNNDG